MNGDNSFCSGGGLLSGRPTKAPFPQQGYVSGPASLRSLCNNDDERKVPVSGTAILRGSLDGLMGAGGCVSADLPGALLAISDIWRSPWMCIKNDSVSL